MNNNFNGTNNSDWSINNNDNDNNITYCNITIIILQFSETELFEVHAKHFNPALIAVTMKTFVSYFHWQVSKNMFKGKWKI